MKNEKVKSKSAGKKNVESKQTKEQIEHPVLTLKQLEKSGKLVSKKTKTFARDRVLKILENNKDIGMTQRMIIEAMPENARLREQHVNNILRKCEEKGEIKRYEVPTQSEKGHMKTLIYNVIA